MRGCAVFLYDIINVFNEKELERENNVHFSHVNGVKKPVPYYSLDVIISVGYRMAYCTLPTVASASQTTPWWP